MKLSWDWVSIIAILLALIALAVLIRIWQP